MELLIIAIIYLSWIESNKVTMGMLVFEGDTGKNKNHQYKTLISGDNINILCNYFSF